MSKIDELHLNITTGCIAMPKAHDKNELIVIPLGIHSWKHAGPPPFASIIAIEGGQRLADKARPAIHVFDIDGQCFYGDGLFCPEERCMTITGGISVARLAEVLRNRRRKWDKFTEVSPKEAPYARLMGWQTKANTWEPNAEQFGPVEALRTYDKWKEKDNAVFAVTGRGAQGNNKPTRETWDEKMYRVLEVDAKKLKANQATSMSERFGDFCRKELGLKLGHTPDFSDSFARLRATLEFAHIIVNGNAFPENVKLMSRSTSGNS